MLLVHIKNSLTLHSLKMIANAVALLSLVSCIAARPTSPPVPVVGPPAPIPIEIIEPCFAVYDPVCGNTPYGGKNFSNECEAKTQNVKYFVKGECNQVCPDFVSPVCGVDGKTYSNKCVAASNGIPVAKNSGKCWDRSN